MTVEFRCADVGVVCRKVTRAESADKLVEAVARHAREKHGVELNETLIDYAKTQVRTRE
jgi:predicted small metal-binding protein